MEEEEEEEEGKKDDQRWKKWQGTKGEITVEGNEEFLLYKETYQWEDAEAIMVFHIVPYLLTLHRSGLSYSQLLGEKFSAITFFQYLFIL